MHGLIDELDFGVILIKVALLLTITFTRIGLSLLNLLQHLINELLIHVRIVGIAAILSHILLDHGDQFVVAHLLVPLILLSGVYVKLGRHSVVNMEYVHVVIFLVGARQHVRAVERRLHVWHQGRVELYVALL